MKASLCKKTFLRFLLLSLFFLLFIPYLFAQDTKLSINLYKAIENNNLDSVKILLKDVEDYNMIYTQHIDRFRRNIFEIPLHTAIYFQSYDIAKYLIDNGSDVNAFKGKTALHYVCAYKSSNVNNDMIKYLTDKGARVYISDYSGQTPLHYYLQHSNGSDEIKNMLKELYQKEKEYLTEQNALIKTELIMTDRVAFDKSFYQSIHKSIFFPKSLYLEYTLSEEINIKDVLFKGIYNRNILKESSYEIYENKHNYCSTEDIDQLMGGYTDFFYDLDPETNEYVLLTKRHEPDINELSELMFFDEWHFDEKNFRFKKEVKAYSPIRVYYRNDDIDKNDARFKLIGWFVFDEYESNSEKKRTERRMKKFMEVKYEYFLHNEELRNNKVIFEDIKFHLEKRNSPFWTGYGKTKFIQLILDQVLTNQSDAYDFNSGEKLTIQKIRENLGEETDTTYETDIESGETIPIISEKPIYPEEIESVIFIEDWYIDEETMRIKKVVNGIAPVRTYYRENDWDMKDPRKEKAFVVYFNK